MSAPIVLRRAVHLAAALGGALALTILLARPAAADDPADQMLGPSQTPSMLSWIQLEDSNGIPLWNFEMSLDRGGVTSPDKFFWASIVDTCWGIYRAVCALALWFIDWVISFDWVSVIASPLIRVGDAMRSVINGIGVVPTFLTLAALLAMLWMLKGKTSTAIYEIAASCIIAALAVGVFADPVRFVAGQDGVIVQAAEAGQQLAARLAEKPRQDPGIAAGDPTADVNLPDLTPDELQRVQTGLLVDTFIRQPTQMINFGRILDGGTCEVAYNDVTRAGTYGNEADIRDAMNDCDESLGKYAASPSASMALGSLVFMPAAFVVLILGVAIGGAVITAGIRAMYQSLKSIVTLITGLLPGGGRMSLMLTVAEVIISMMIIVFASIFMGVFLLTIQALFASGTADTIPATFVAADVFIIGGIVVFLRQHKQIKALNHRMAQWMSRRPGGGSPGRLPDRNPGLNMGHVTNAAHLATNLARLRQGRAARPTTGAPAVEGTRPIDIGHVTATPRTHTAPAPASASPNGPGLLTAGPNAPQTPPGNGSPVLPPGGPGAPQLPSGASQRIGAAGEKKTGRKVLGLATSVGAHALLAYATGGVSTLATGAKAASSATRMAKAAGAMRNARRAALATRMAVNADKTRSPGTKPLRARPAPITPPPASPSARSSADRAASRDKGAPRPQGKGYRQPGKTPGVSVLRPGDAGYLTSREALASSQGRRPTQEGRRSAPRA